MAIASEFDEVLRNRTDDESGQICRRPSAVFSRPMLCRLLVSLAAPFALAITLLRASPCQAIPPGGPLPPPDCAGDVTGRLTATPASFDREKDLNFDTTLTWSVTIPKGCPVGSFTLADSPVPRSGSELIQNVLSARTFALVLTSRGLHRTLASVRVNVAGDPGLITVSPGARWTADDITIFNEQWMQPLERAQAIGFATSTLGHRDPDGVWGNGERMAALVRMFQLTHDARYLDHLREFIHLALQFRDDLPFDPPAVTRPVDMIRNQVGVPAWGGDGGTKDVEGVEYGGLSHIEEVVSNLYAYPIAAFARIVAEDPSLQAAYGAEAVADANLIFQTVAFFLPQIHTQRVGDFIEARLTQSLEFVNRPTAADCTKAFNQAMMDHRDDASRWTQQNSDCNVKREGAGRDFPHNINLTFSMVLIELARADNSSFYQQAPNRSIAAELGKDVLLRTAIRQQRYFSNHLWTGNSSTLCPFYLCWNYGDDVPTDHNPHVEDLDHGAMDMSYVEVFQQSYSLLSQAAQRFNEPLALGPKDLQAIARTFAADTGQSNFAHDLAGHDEPPPYSANSRCEGWVTLARQGAPEIYQRCHDVSLRVVDGAQPPQPYLNMGNHSSLLANKQFGPPQ
jgi:hypothetical protein